MWRSKMLALVALSWAADDCITIGPFCFNDEQEVAEFRRIATRQRTNSDRRARELDWDKVTPKMVWGELYQAEVACQFERRVGGLSDGAKWVCDPASLIGELDDCLVYSIGSGNNWVFEEAILQLNPRCEIHTFDHTTSAENLPEGVHFHSVGLGPMNETELPPVNSPVIPRGRRLKRRRRGPRPQVPGLNSTMSLPDILTAGGHGERRISILKVDVEGAEYPSLIPILERNSDVIKADQVLIELHGDPPQARRLLDGFLDAGYFIFHTEPNVWGALSLAQEFSLIHLPQLLDQIRGKGAR